jgi:hypothetical protein
LFTVASAAIVQPGNIAVTVGCGFTLRITDAANAQTLQLEPNDPIFAGPCVGDALSIKNTGRNALNRSFTLDCNQAGTLRGSNIGTGIRIRGAGITVMNCTLSGFHTGVVASGDGETVQDTTAENCAADGFDIRDSINLNSASFSGTFISSDQALHNAGVGFALKGNGFTLDNSGNIFLTSLADGNLRGGFVLNGRENTISGCDASNNGGPGFAVIEKSCCSINYSFDTSRAVANTGPGIVYIGRDDGTNCVGGICYPGGVDLSGSSTGIFAFDNGGVCPPGTLPFPPTSSGQICLAAKSCGQGELNKC